MKFRDLMAQLDYGQTEAELDAAVAEIVAATREHKKKGSLTFTLNFGLVPNSETQVEITEAIKVVKPQRGRASTTLFIQKDGSLSRRDPRQPELPMQPGDRPRAVVIDKEEEDAAANG